MNLITEIKDYALAHDVPIMSDDSIALISEVLRNTNSRSLLEIGTAVGYSSIRIAHENPDLEITTIEKEIQRYMLASEYISRTSYSITSLCANALHFKNRSIYDATILDAAKAQNEPLFKLYFAFTNKVMIVDNIDFHGYTGTSETIKSRNLRQMIARIERFIEYLSRRDDLTVDYHQVGDGILVIKRKEMGS